MGVKAEIEEAVVNFCHATVSCGLIDGVLSFVKADELFKRSLGVDNGDSQFVVFGIAAAAEDESFFIRIPVVGITVSEERVVRFVGVVPPDGMVFDIVEGGIESDE